MKIILFADKLPPEIGGMETHAHYFIQHFSKKNNLTIISKKNNYDVIVSYDYQVKKKIVLFDFLKSFSNEICVVFYNSGYWIEKIAEIKLSLPHAVFIYRTGGNEIIKASLNQDIKEHSQRQKYWVNAINQNINYLIANSQFTKNRMIDLGIQSEIVEIISGGIDIIDIEKAIKVKLQTRKMLNFNDTNKLIVCCCRFVPYKRTDFLLRAFQFLSNQHNFFLVGDGDLFFEIKSMAKEMNLNISFLGRLNHEKTLNIIATADIYCQASTDLIVNVKGGSYVHTEGMGRSLIEAICVGTRVVATNCGAIGEFINSANGILVNSNEKEFAKQIEIALSLPLIEEKTRKFYCNEYSFEKIFNQYECLWS